MNYVFHKRTADSTIFSLPRMRLKGEHNHLDWIDDYESTIVDASFCDWLAERYHAPAPQTDEIVASDPDLGIHLCRWNPQFVRAMISHDSDLFGGMIGGDSTSEAVVSFKTWMTQRQAWLMWGFFHSSIRDDYVVVEIRVG